MAEPPPKRRRLSRADEAPSSSAPGTGPASLSRSISPPGRRSLLSAPPAILRDPSTGISAGTTSVSLSVEPPIPEEPQPPPSQRKLLPSPFRLTTIRDLPDESNAGAVSLSDLLGDPLISECWEFNYLHDIEYLMDHFDEDTRALVKVHVVHGFWKREDRNRLSLHEQASQYENVRLHTAYMPEIFGTHHSKMMILFRHDDTAQVIIHTANMISKDWTNMTNAVWQSPPLPLLEGSNASSQSDAQVGNGHRFKADLLSYLRAYNTNRDVCKPLVESLERYDFSAVRGAIIASVPGRHAVEDDPNVTRFGWAAMKHALRSVPLQPGKSEIVVQISSIATLGGTDVWLQRTLFESLSSPGRSDPKPSFKVVFPTPCEIIRSLDGYASGGSIHTKIQSAQQARQLMYLRPMFCHWANDTPAGITNTQGASSHLGTRDAGRQRAAPHVKTYIRYTSRSTIDWALLTSANISKQAWGEASTASHEFRVASWEIGVLVWPELLADNDKGAKMVGTFKTDVPSPADIQGTGGDVGNNGDNDDDRKAAGTIVGLRIPYNLPLQKYGPNEKPWVATAEYKEPDWTGRTWESWTAG
ncbi:tyrosyl-DNA phosphodiesterase [Xylariales sp. AK1849]|nr:tyrosyl-DNA phosphodiesterase [Xylariales sp. AK1849]